MREASRRVADGPWWERDPGWRLAAPLGLLATLIVATGARAWLPAMNDPDSMSTVLYFQRLAAGERLETVVLTTPKPLLTVIYGLTWTLLQDWRAIVWETMAVWGVAVAAATRAASRLGGIGASLFLFSVLASSSAMFLSVAQANSVVWAFAGWAVAAVAVSARPRRYWLAGVALLVAGSIRLETWAILVVATAVIVLLAIPGLRRPGWPSWREPAPLLLGWLALGPQLVHDLLLNGDPLWWSRVSVTYTRLVTPELEPIGPLQFALDVLARYAAAPALTAMAIIGFAHLVSTRSWAVLVGLTGLVGGVLATLGLLAARAVTIPDRYFEQATLGLIFAAALAAGWLVRVFGGVLARAAPERIRAAAPVVLLVAPLLAIGVVRPWPLDPALDRLIPRLRFASANVGEVMPRLREVVEARGSPPPAVEVIPGVADTDARQAPLLVPRSLRTRVVVELKASLTEVADSRRAFLESPPEDSLVRGQHVYHDARIDTPESLYRVLEVEERTRLDGLNLVPVEVSPGAYWLVRVEEAGP